MKFVKKYFAVLTGLFVFIIYLSTIAPSVVEIDSGELATVQATLGIAHPTGYPLFTILGYLFSLLPLPFTKIYQLNLLTAIWCSLGVGVFVYTAKLVLDNLNSFKSQKIEVKPVEKKVNKKKSKSKSKGKNNESKVKVNTNDFTETVKYISSIFAGLILAFSQTFWFQGTSVEVYSLQLFLINLIILFLIKAYLSKSEYKNFSTQNPWLWFAAALALGFANHMTTLFILPGVAYLFFEKYRLNKNSFIKIAVMLSVFFPILILIYLYLPIRASQNPILNWGNPDTLHRFLRHVSGAQYQVWFFSSTASAKKQLTHFITTLPAQFNVSLLVIFIGLIATYFKAKKFFIFMLITFLFTVLYSINYEIHDIDSYFLLAYISMSFFAVFGVIQIFSSLKTNKITFALPSALILIFIFVEGFTSYNAVNQSDTYTFKDYTTAILKNVDKNSIIFSYQWDYFVSPSLYFQNVEKMCPDVTVVDKELLRRSWYFHQLEVDHPKLLSGMKEDVNLFLKALAPFENGEKFNPNLLERLYRKLMTDLVGTNINRKSLYVAPELFEKEMQKGEFTLPKGYTLVPSLLLFKVVKGNQYVPAPNPNFTIRFPKDGNEYTKFIMNIVASMLARRALYEMQFNKIDRAKLYVKKIKSTIPDYNLPPGLEEILKK